MKMNRTADKNCLNKVQAGRPDNAPRAVAATPMPGVETRADSETGAELFVPITDDLLYDHPDRITGPLVAYAPGHVCSHWLSIEINPVDDPFALTDDLIDNAAA